MTGDELRELLVDTGWTKRAFARRLGVDYATLKRWMTGGPIHPHTTIVLVALREGRITWEWIDQKCGLEKSPASGTIATS